MTRRASFLALGTVLILVTGCPFCHMCSGAQHIEACGTLVEGVECVLFQTDDGRQFVLTDAGSFQVGQRVEVHGWLDPDCVSICQQGEGCITVAMISECFE